MATSTPKQDKTMSSRLSAMKFMQRGAATSSPQSAPSTPESRPTKRPRLSAPSNLHGAQRPEEQSLKQQREEQQVSEQLKLQDTLADEEAKLQRTLDRQAVEAGDSKWELEAVDEAVGEGLNVISAGYTMIDESRAKGGAEDGNEVDDRLPVTRTSSGRKSFGKFNKVIEKQQDPQRYQSSSSSSEDDEATQFGSEEEVGEESHSGEDEEAEISTSKRRRTSAKGDEIRAERKAKRKAEKQDAAQQADRRRNKQVKLNKLTSISGFGGGGGGKSKPQVKKCYTCGSPDHQKSACPKRTVGARWQ